MAAPIIAELTQTVTDTVGVMKSATVALNGVQQRITDGIAKGLELGATEAELQPFIQLETDLETEKTNLAEAVAKNP